MKTGCARCYEHRTRPNHIFCRRQKDMATTKAKRSVHPKQLTEAARRNNRRASPARRDHPDRRKPAERRTHNHSSTTWLRKVIHFPQANGKLVEDVEFSTELGYHCITVNFNDKTSLNFEI